MGDHRPRMRTDRPVVLAQEGLQLGAMRAAGVERSAIETSAVPDEPPCGAGIHVLAEAVVEQLPFEAGLGHWIWRRRAKLATEDQPDGHRSQGIARRHSGAWGASAPQSSADSLEAAGVRE